MINKQIIQECLDSFQNAVENIYSTSLEFENFSRSIQSIIIKLSDHLEDPALLTQQIKKINIHKLFDKPQRPINQQFKTIIQKFNDPTTFENQSTIINFVTQLKIISLQYMFYVKTYFSDMNTSSIYRELLEQLSPHKTNVPDLKLLLNDLYNGFGQNTSITKFKSSIGKLSEYETASIRASSNDVNLKRRLRSSIVNAMFSPDPMSPENISCIKDAYNALLTYYNQKCIDPEFNNIHFNRINSYLKSTLNSGESTWTNSVNSMLDNPPQFIDSSNLLFHNLMFLHNEYNINKYTTNSWIASIEAKELNLKLKPGQSKNSSSIIVTVPSYSLIFNDNGNKLSLGMINDETVKIKLIELLKLDFSENFNLEILQIIDDFNSVNPKLQISLIVEPINKPIDFYNMDQFELQPKLAFKAPKNLNIIGQKIISSYADLEQSSGLVNSDIVASLTQIELPKLFNQVPKKKYFIIYPTSPNGLQEKEFIKLVTENTITNELRKSIWKNTNGIMFRNSL